MSEKDSGATAPSKLALIPKADGPVPKHSADARGHAIIEERGTHVCVERAQVFDIIQQLKQLSPCHKDRHRFHERKDELVSKLFTMATAS